MRVKQQGIALLTALLIVSLAATAAVTIASQLQREIRRSGNILHHDQAKLYITAAEDFARYGLKLDHNAGKIDHLNELWHIVPVAEEIDGGTLYGRLDDLQGLFNLNNLANKKAIDQQRFNLLLTNLGLTPNEIQQVTAVIEDWLDPDQTSTLAYGAEDDYYLGLTAPDKAYLAANRLFSHLSELRLLKDLNTELLRKLRIMPSLDEETGELLTEVFTVLPEYTELNINTAPAEVLRALDAQISEVIAEQIISQRDGAIATGGDVTPFNDTNEFKTYLESLAVKNVNLDSIITNTNYFLLQTSTTIGDSTMSMNSTLKRDDKGFSQVVSRSQEKIR